MSRNLWEGGHTAAERTERRKLGRFETGPPTTEGCREGLVNFLFLCGCLTASTDDGKNLLSTVLHVNEGSASALSNSMSTLYEYVKDRALHCTLELRQVL